MKARMQMAMETTWGNQCVLSVESELDNPHDMTTDEITDVMVWTLKTMCQHVRLANERAILNEPGTSREVRDTIDRVRRETGGQRERERHAEMMRERTSEAERRGESDREPDRERQGG